MGTQRSSIELLEDLGALVLASDGGDRTAIIQIGSGIEEVLAGLAASPDMVTALLSDVLGTLQKLHEGQAPDVPAAMAAIADALAAIRQWISGSPAPGETRISVPQAAQKLAAACAAGAEPPATTAATAQPPSDATQASSPRADSPAAAPAQQSAAQAEPRLPADVDVDLLKEFVTECLDHIANGEAAMLALESQPDDGEQINVIFRAFHTIKGTSGFLGLDHMQRLAHLAENLLDRARNQQISLTGSAADLALKSCDMLRAMAQPLRELAGGEVVPVPQGFDALLAELSNPCLDDAPAPAAALRLGEILVAKGADRGAVERVAAAQGEGPIGQALVAAGTASATEVVDALRTQKAQERGSALDATVRLNIERLDSLIDTVGELVIAHSMVAQDPEVTLGRSPRLSRSVGHAGKIIRELQDLTLSLRMVPLKGLFQKMARLVRDLSKKAGKQVRFVCEGEDTEIDRNMVEVLGDPLVHMIRNAVDHGIEPADKRAAAGKDATGTVTLRAYHSAGNVVIELRDDGRGLNKEKIVAKAVERNLIAAGRELTDAEAFALIFQAGFSTADKITDISGRGVGMDVVKKGIDSLRGRIDVASQLGHGATFALRLPLTMAITDAMLLRVGHERYLMPTASIEHSFRPAAADITSVAGKGEMVMLRGQLLRVLRLHELLGINDAVTEPCKGLMVVIEGDGRRCALMADELLGQQQVVIKSLGRCLGSVKGVAGGAILGDGRVGLILDPAGLIHLADGKTNVKEAA
jgi:two-component system chemotaxis sensor kinase CheA